MRSLVSTICLIRPYEHKYALVPCWRCVSLPPLVSALSLSMVGVVAADLISGFFECILYGVFFVLSTTSLVLLLRRHSSIYGQSPEPTLRSWSQMLATIWTIRRSPLIIANVLLIITITVHCAISAHRLMLAIVNHENTEQAADFISDLGETTQVIRLIFLFVDMFIGDLVITYRVWLVWGRRRDIVVLPVLTTAALVATGIGLIRQFIISRPNGSIFDPQVSRWITAYCIMTFCTNIYGTVVIAYRIWTSNRLLHVHGLSDGGRSLMEAMAIFVESAALYTAWGIFFVVVYGTKSHLQIIGTGCAPSVLGVTFMLITVRVGLGWAQESKSTGSASDIQWAPPPLTRSQRTQGGMDSIPLQSLSLHAARTGDEDLERSLSVLRSRHEKSAPDNMLKEVV